jgi:hypothetical protein
MSRITVNIVSEGFLHPAPRLDAEVIGAHGFVHVPVADLDSDVQFFRCRVACAGDSAASEWILADASLASDREVAGRFLSDRFPDSSTVFLRSQALGRAAVDCPADSALTQPAAAAVAVVMFAAACDESESIVVEGGGARHAFAVGSDAAGHFASPVSVQA